MAKFLMISEYQDPPFRPSNMFELPIENIFCLEKTQYPVMARPLMKFFEVQITNCYFDYSSSLSIEAVILVNTKFCGK